MIDTLDKLRFYTVEQLGPSMYTTPEGYLVVYDTPIARTGIMHYGPGETPIEPGPDGIVKIDRHPEDVFRPESIASLVGKPIVNDHPDDDVNPENWNALAVGVVMNVRQGKGIEDNLLVADLQITNAQAISDVRSGKRELSCGYMADYIETGAGQAYQTNILYNHLAIVERGRCGSRCLIRDNKSRVTDSCPEGANMFKKWIDALKAAIAAKDEKKIEELFKAEPTPTRDDDPHIHIHGGNKWNDEALEKKFAEHDKKFADHEGMMAGNHKSVMDALEEIKKGMPKTEDDAETKEIEGELEEEAPAGTGDKARKAKDSVYMADSYQQTIAMAEIISPGLHYATFDSARDPKKTFKDMCGLRRKALQLGNNDPVTNGIIEKIRGGKTMTADALEKMPCHDVRTLFYTAATIKRESNNAVAAKDKTVTAAVPVGGPVTIADWNKANREYWAKQ